MVDCMMTIPSEKHLTGGQYNGTHIHQYNNTRVILCEESGLEISLQSSGIQ